MIELVDVKYWIEQKKSYEEHDSPCIGASTHHPLGKKRLGPYNSVDEATAQLEIIKDGFVKQGWRVAVTDLSGRHLMKHNEDLWFSITKESKTIGNLGGASSYGFSGSR